MVKAVVLAPIVALIVWYSANQFGITVTYVMTLVAVIVAKVLASYLVPARTFTFEYVEKETEENDDK